LRLEGYRVVLAADVAGALEAMLSDAIDLVITDAHMPGDVRETIRRAHEIDPRVPVIVYSGAEDGLRNELASMADAFVRKMDGPEALLAAAATYLSDLP
jgi:CheY-like chemotaxis protein